MGSPSLFLPRRTVSISVLFLAASCFAQATEVPPTGAPTGAPTTIGDFPPAPLPTQAIDDDYDDDLDSDYGKSAKCCEELGFEDKFGSRAVCGDTLRCDLTDVTHAEAEATCLGMGARLCSLEEVAGWEVKGTGCSDKEGGPNFDPLMTWTSTSCIDDDWAGKMVSIGRGLGYDRVGEEFPGNQPIRKEQCLPLSAQQSRAAVRCCADSCTWSPHPKSETCCGDFDKDLKFMDKFGSENVCGGTPWCGMKEVTHKAAYEQCKSVGARLCTKEEVAEGEVRGTGCSMRRGGPRFNPFMTWTSTPCIYSSADADDGVDGGGFEGDLGYVAAIGRGLGWKRGFPVRKEMCVPNWKEAEAAVRCCADVCPSDGGGDGAGLAAGGGAMMLLAGVVVVGGFAVAKVRQAFKRPEEAEAGSNNWAVHMQTVENPLTKQGSAFARLKEFATRNKFKGIVRKVVLENRVVGMFSGSKREGNASTTAEDSVYLASNKSDDL